ncbi:MAG: DUF3040 domain-containing protein [Sciscionella sp.]
MLSKRERQALVRIERHFIQTDPRLVGLFRSAMSHPRNQPTARATSPWVLAAGLLLMVVGGVSASIPLAVFGMGLAVFALVFSAASSASTRRRSPPGFA